MVSSLQYWRSTKNYVAERGITAKCRKVQDWEESDILFILDILYWELKFSYSSCIQHAADIDLLTTDLIDPTVGENKIL